MFIGVCVCVCVCMRDKETFPFVKENAESAHPVSFVVILHCIRAAPRRHRAMTLKESRTIQLQTSSSVFPSSCGHEWTRYFDLQAAKLTVNRRLLASVRWP